MVCPFKCCVGSLGYYSPCLYQKTDPTFREAAISSLKDHCLEFYLVSLTTRSHAMIKVPVLREAQQNADSIIAMYKI